MASDTLDRDELIRLVRRIMSAEGQNEEEADALIELFEANVPRPGASDLIFWPKKALGDDFPGRELLPEEVVDIALSYRPIAL